MDMDPSYSDINEVYYKGPIENDASDPLSPNYYQDHPYQQNSYTFSKPQHLSRSPAYHDYQITNDHRGQYVLKRQELNIPLLMLRVITLRESFANFLQTKDYLSLDEIKLVFNSCRFKTY